MLRISSVTYKSIGNQIRQVSHYSRQELVGVTTRSCGPLDSWAVLPLVGLVAPRPPFGRDASSTPHPLGRAWRRGTLSGRAAWRCDVGLHHVMERRRWAGRMGTLARAAPLTLAGGNTY